MLSVLSLYSLCTLYGEPTDVLADVTKLSTKFPALENPIERLKAVLDGLGDVKERCLLDLGETQRFDYYTGVVFHAYIPGAGQAVATGGRYDQLLARYGRDLPAAGFAIDEEGLTCQQ